MCCAAELKRKRNSQDQKKNMSSVDKFLIEVQGRLKTRKMMEKLCNKGLIIAW